MKKYILMILCLFLISCSESINLRKGVVESKRTYDDSYSKYYIIKNGDTDTSKQCIYAAPDFAKVGDTIGSKDGVIKVIKRGNHK